MKDMIQSRNNVTQSLNRLEAKVSHLVNTINDRNEETLPNTFSTIPHSPSHIDEELWHLGDFSQDSISPQNFKLDQYQTIDKLASFRFSEIEYEPSILDSHVPLLKNECELEFYNLDQTHELTPTLKPKLI